MSTIIEILTAAALRFSASSSREAHFFWVRETKNITKSLWPSTVSSSLAHSL